MIRPLPQAMLGLKGTTRPIWSSPISRSPSQTLKLALDNTRDRKEAPVSPSSTTLRGYRLHELRGIAIVGMGQRPWERGCVTKSSGKSPSSVKVRTRSPLDSRPTALHVRLTEDTTRHDD